MVINHLLNGMILQVGPTERAPNPENLMVLAIYLGVRW